MFPHKVSYISSYFDCTSFFAFVHINGLKCIELLMKPHLRATECHLSYGMGSHSVTCHPTQVNAPRLNPSQTGWYSIYLPQRERRLSWPIVWS